MAAAFQYKPKFKDIRVRPPSKEEDLRAEDVNALKPKMAPANGAPEAPTPQVRPVSQPPAAAVPAPVAVKPAPTKTAP